MGLVFLVGRKREELRLPVDRPDVIPSPIDSRYECVRVPAGSRAAPPPEGAPETDGPRLCPDGYVPRLRRRPLHLEGKLIRPSGPAERNPCPPDQS
jgi:hypothetical protein